MIGDQNKMLRDHDNIIKNLRQEVNELKDKQSKQEKVNKNVNRDIDEHDQAIKDCKLYTS